MQTSITESQCLLSQALPLNATIHNINLKRNCYISEHYSHFDSVHLQQKVIGKSLVFGQVVFSNLFLLHMTIYTMQKNLKICSVVLRMTENQLYMAYHSA